LSKSMDTDNRILEIKNLSHIFNRLGMKINALSNISLDIYRGEWNMLLGLNGAGKSTLMQLVCGEISGASQGEILFDGINILGKNRNFSSDKFAMIEQDPKLSSVANLTIFEHFALAKNNGKSWLFPKTKRLRQEVSKILKPYGLETKLDHAVGSLSGGERQILAFLLAVHRKVDILFLDEPIASLDKNNSLACLEAVKKAAKEGLTIIMITHDFHIACDYGDRQIGLAKGRLVFDLKDKNEHLWDPYQIWKELQHEQK
jgi:putative tryptophan/tyrosine transport system ATP-binding protein